MKHFCFAVVLAALTPALARAQKPQFTSCHSLELAANFIGADEVLVDGKVCKVAKSSSASSVIAPEKAAEQSKVLLGIVEPETLRAGEKTDSQPAAVVPSPTAPGGGTTAERTTERAKALLGIIEPETLREKPDPDPGKALPAPAGNAVPGAGPAASSTQLPGSFEMVQTGSLADVARAYRKSVATETKDAPSGAAQEKQQGLGVESRATAIQTLVPTPAVLETTPAVKKAATATAEATKVEGRREGTPAARAPAPTMPTQEQPGKTAMTAIATSQSQVAAGAPEFAPVQAPARTDTLPAAPKPPTSEQPDVSAAPSAREEPPVLEPDAAREKAVKMGAFVVPVEAPSAEGQPQPLSDTDAEVSAFREGQVPSCRKNISLGSMKNESLFLAIPDWALAWYVKNQKKFPGICFSNAIMPGAENFLVVFHTTAQPAGKIGEASKASATSSAEVSPVNGQGGFTTSYGAMWHYVLEKEVTTTITSVSADKAPHNRQPSVIFATAYTEQGIPVAQHWPASVTGKNKVKEPSRKSGRNHEAVDPASLVMEQLLSQMVQDIAKL